MQGVWRFVKWISQIRTRLVHIDVAESEIAIVRIQLSQQVRANAGENGQQIRGSKTSSVLEIQNAYPRIDDSSTWNGPSPCSCRRKRNTLVGYIDRVKADRVEVATCA